MLLIALLLRRRRVGFVYLGADVPTGDLIAAASDLEPAIVCLAASSAGGRASLARAARLFIRQRAPGRLLVGGPALQAEDPTIPGERLPDRLGAAADVIARAVDDARAVGA